MSRIDNNINTMKREAEVEKEMVFIDIFYKMKICLINLLIKMN
jgi:hypothetical protein